LAIPRPGNPFPTISRSRSPEYLADLHGHKAPHDTTALINIGSNDYDAFFSWPDPRTIQSYVANVVGSIEQAVDALTQAGVEKIILYTLPDFGITPNAQAEGAQVVAMVHRSAESTSAALPSDRRQPTPTCNWSMSFN